MNETFLSDADLADRFNVARQTVWRWHRSNPGFPRAVSLSPGCTRWKLSAIERWEKQLSETG